MRGCNKLKKNFYERKEKKSDVSCEGRCLPEFCIFRRNNKILFLQILVCHQVFELFKVYFSISVCICDWSKYETC